MPARILPPAGMRTGPCPSSVGSAGCAPLIVTTALVTLRLLCDAKELASIGSRMNASLQVLALLTTVLVCPSLSSQRAGPSARALACPIAAASSRLSGSIVRRPEVWRELLRNRLGDCQGATPLFSLHPHGQWRESCRCFGRWSVYPEMDRRKREG